MTPDKKVLIWQRNVEYQPSRNSSISLINQIANRLIQEGVIPVIVGPPQNIEGAINIGEFWKEDFFCGRHGLVKQLWFQEKLFACCGVKASVGMKSGILDGISMYFGRKTIFFARPGEMKRMKKVCEVVPSLVGFELEFDESLENLEEEQLNNLIDEINRRGDT